MTNLFDPTLPAFGAQPADSAEVRNNFNSAATLNADTADLLNPAVGMPQYRTDTDLLRIISSLGPTTYRTLIEDITGTPYVGYWRDPVTNFASLPGSPGVDWEIHALQNVGGNPILYINDPNSPQTWRPLAPGPGIAMLYDSANDEYDVDVGVGADQIPQLDSAGRLPAVDGSNLTNNVTQIQDDPITPTATATGGVSFLEGVGISILFGSTDDLTIAVDPGSTVISIDKFGSGSPDFTGAVFLKEDPIPSVCITEEPSTNSLIFTARCAPIDPTFITDNCPGNPATATETSIFNWATSVFTRVGVAPPSVMDSCDVLRAIIVKLNAVQQLTDPNFQTPSWEDKDSLMIPPNPFEPDSPVEPPPLLPPGANPPLPGGTLPSGSTIPGGTLQLDTDLNRLVRWDSVQLAWLDDVHRFDVFEKAALRNTAPITSLNFEGAVTIVETAAGVLTLTYDLQQFAHGATHTFDGTDPLVGIFQFGGTTQPVFELGNQAVPGNRTLQATIQATTAEPAIRYNQTDCRWEARKEDGTFGPIAVNPATLPAQTTGAYFMEFSVPGIGLGAGDSIAGDQSSNVGIPLPLGGTLVNVHFTSPDATQGGFAIDIENESTAVVSTITFTGSTLFETVAAPSPTLVFLPTEQLSITVDSITSPIVDYYQIVLEFSY